MRRPALLVAEPEPLEALSTRKLVLETGKFNVITAHSTHEAIDIFSTFPKLSGLVLVEGNKINGEAIAQAIRSSGHTTPIISLAPNPGAVSAFADYTLSSHEPIPLLELLRKLFGDPRLIDGQG